MRRLIDAEEAYKVLTDYYHHKTEIQHDALKEAIERVPIVDPVKHGHWRTVTLPSYMFEGYRCSECDELVYGRTKYCPHCGAKMDEVEDI